MLQRSYYKVLVLALVFGSLLSCSSSDNPMTPPASNMVIIQDNSFNPATVNVAVGRVVVWRNDGGTTHTVTSGSPSSNPGGIFNSGNLRPGAGFQFTFSQPGQYPYFCTIHGVMMSGMVVVQ